jgi:hypothetical protein
MESTTLELSGLPWTFSVDYAGVTTVQIANRTHGLTVDELERLHAAIGKALEVSQQKVLLLKGAKNDAKAN